MTFARQPKVKFQRNLFIAASVIVLAWTGAANAADFTFENFQLQPPNNKESSVSIKLIDVRGSNLSKEEFAKLLNVDTPKEEGLALIKKLQADSISVPEAVVTNTGKSPGAVTFRGYQVSKISGGRFAKLSLASIDGKFKPEDGGGGEAVIKAGALSVEDADFSRLLDAIVRGNAGDATSRIGKLDFRGLDVSFPEKSAGGSLMHTFKIASITASSTYQGELPLKGVAEVKNMLFIPAPQSGAAAAMEQFGYKQTDMGLRAEGTYNPDKKSYDLADFAISGINAGVISLKGLFGSIGPDAFNGTQIARLGALMAGDVSNVTLRYADNGLFDKALVFFAKTNGKDPMAVRQEWAGMVAGLLPMMTGGDPGAMKIASAVSEFIKAPKSLTITLKGKGGPVRFADLQQIKDPTELLKKIDIEASANK